MKDTKSWLERLRTEEAECRLISKLATNATKQDVFATLAETHKKMADELEEVIASESIPSS